MANDGVLNVDAAVAEAAPPTMGGNSHQVPQHVQCDSRPSQDLDRSEDPNPTTRKSRANSIDVLEEDTQRGCYLKIAVVLSHLLAAASVGCFIQAVRDQHSEDWPFKVGIYTPHLPLFYTDSYHSAVARQ